MIGYLFGELSESEKSHLEDLVFREENYFTALQVVEEQLIDDYLENVLSPEQRQKFESDYLISDRRRQKLQFARTLKQSLETIPTVQPAHENFSFGQAICAFRQTTTIRWASVAAALICLLIGIWFVLRSQEIKPDVAGSNPAASPEATSTQNTLANNTSPPSFSSPAASSAAVGSSPQRKPLPEQTKSLSLGTVMSVLSPGLLRDDEANATANTIVVSSQTKTIILHLKHAPNPAYSAYRATLENVTGKSLLTRDGLKSDPRRQTLRWSIPAQQLPTNDYVINLFGKNARGEYEEVSDFSFRVMKK